MLRLLLWVWTGGPAAAVTYTVMGPLTDPSERMTFSDPSERMVFTDPSVRMVFSDPGEDD